jgi:hypothetical protein
LTTPLTRDHDNRGLLSASQAATGEVNRGVQTARRRARAESRGFHPTDFAARMHAAHRQPIASEAITVYQSRIGAAEPSEAEWAIRRLLVYGQSMSGRSWRGDLDESMTVFVPAERPYVAFVLVDEIVVDVLFAACLHEAHANRVSRQAIRVYQLRLGLDKPLIAERMMRQRLTFVRSVPASSWRADLDDSMTLIVPVNEPSIAFVLADDVVVNVLWR